MSVRTIVSLIRTHCGGAFNSLNDMCKQLNTDMSSAYTLKQYVVSPYRLCIHLERIVFFTKLHTR